MLFKREIFAISFLVETKLEIQLYKKSLYKISIMDRNENMFSSKHRDREKLLGELAKLENEEAAC